MSAPVGRTSTTAEVWPEREQRRSQTEPDAPGGSRSADQPPAWYYDAPQHPCRSCGLAVPKYRLLCWDCWGKLDYRALNHLRRLTEEWHGGQLGWLHREQGIRHALQMAGLPTQPIREG